MTGGAGIYYREVRQRGCPWCHARPGDPCRRPAGRVLGPGREHQARVKAWQAWWPHRILPAPSPGRIAGRQACPVITGKLNGLMAGMRSRPGFAGEAP
jgi:hypothetical protein